MRKPTTSHSEQNLKESFPNSVGDVIVIAAVTAVAIPLTLYTIEFGKAFVRSFRREWKNYGQYQADTNQ